MSINMRSIALFAASALAQTQYGDNHVTVDFDSQIVEQRAFPAPNVTLYSPAFITGANASFEPGWFDGSEGATSQDKLGMCGHFASWEQELTSMKFHS